MVDAGDETDLFQDTLAEYGWARDVAGLAASTLQQVISPVVELCTHYECAPWRLTPRHLDRYFAGPGKRAHSTVRAKLVHVDGYFAFLEQRDAGEIVRRFGIAVESPVDRFNQPRHRGDFGVRIPPSRRAMREFFTSWRDDLDNARKYPIAVQDHVMAKIAYLFAEGRELLWWYIEEIRAEFTDDPDDPQAPLWPSERLPSAVAALNIAPVACPVGPDTFRRALAAAATQHLSGPVHRLHPHLLRHACATHNYESGMPLWDVQQLLGARLGVHHGRVSLDRPRRSRAAQSRIVRPRCPPIDHRRIRP